MLALLAAVNTPRYLALTALLLLSTAGAAATEIYRWVDADGSVHYSSVAPRDIPHERIDPGGIRRPAPTLASPDLRDSAPPATLPVPERVAPANDETDLTAAQEEARRALAAEAAASRAALIEQQRELCQQARERYRQLTTHARVRVRSESGETRLLSEEELQSQLAQAQNAIVTHCE